MHIRTNTGQLKQLAFAFAFGAAAKQGILRRPSAMGKKGATDRQSCESWRLGCLLCCSECGPRLSTRALPAEGDSVPRLRWRSRWMLLVLVLILIQSVLILNVLVRLVHIQLHRLNRLVRLVRLGPSHARRGSRTRSHSPRARCMCPSRALAPGVVEDGVVHAPAGAMRAAGDLRRDGVPPGELHDVVLADAASRVEVAVRPQVEAEPRPARLGR